VSASCSLIQSMCLLYWGKTGSSTAHEMKAGCVVCSPSAVDCIL